jgi:hypothetical protein
MSTGGGRLIQAKEGSIGWSQRGELIFRFWFFIKLSKGFLEMHVMVKIALVLKNDILTMPRAPTHAHDALEHLEEGGAA